MKTMQAARLVEIGKPLEIAELGIPQPATGEILVRIRAVGICSSDIHYQDGRSKVARLPITLGHEIAGEVAACGKGATLFKPGDRVCLFYLVTCGKCMMCCTDRDNYCKDAKMLGKNIDGGFAEYLVVPERNAFAFPVSIPFSRAALMTDAVATPFHALKRAHIQTGEGVLVIGIGGLGIHAVQIARIMGAGKVIAMDLSPEKLDLAEKAGATAVINPLEDNVEKKIEEITEGRGVDVAIELIGLTRTIRQAVDSTGRGGRTVIVGICPEEMGLNPYHDLLLKERTILGSADQSRADFPIIIELVAQGRLDLSHSVSLELPLAEINRGLDILRNKKDNPVRIVVTFP
ncbi:MAG: zinc-binding dehydrogenase [Bacillota bacterium]|nr:zinc-binding dehydrogenase [Bacillota bacterium]